MIIHVVEPLASGHRLGFVRHIAQAAKRRGHRVLLSTVASYLRLPAARELADLAETVPFSPADEAEIVRLTDAGGEALAWHRLFARHWRRLPVAERGDMVLVPYADYILLASGIARPAFAGTPWIGIAMRVSSHHAAAGVDTPPRRGDGLRSWLFGRALARRGLRRLLTLDETLPPWAARHWPSRAGKCRQIGDPADALANWDRQTARVRFDLPEAGVRVVLCYGAIDLRKGLCELAAATLDSQWPSDALVLVLGAWMAGGLADHPAIIASRGRGRMVVVDRWADADDEAAAFAAADVVWLGYRGFHQSSGVLMQAGVAGLPVIACREGLIGWLSSRYQLGPVIDVADPAAVAQAVATACRGPAAEGFRPPTGTEMGERVINACENLP